LKAGRAATTQNAFCRSRFSATKAEAVKKDGRRRGTVLFPCAGLEPTPLLLLYYFVNRAYPFFFRAITPKADSNTPTRLIPYNTHSATENENPTRKNNIADSRINRSTDTHHCRKIMFKAMPKPNIETMASTSNKNQNPNKADTPQL
jgi:hypothetical protein